MKKEKKFIVPECEIVHFNVEDVITTSNGDPNFPGNVDEGSTDVTPFW